MLPEAAFIVEVDNTNVLSTIFFTIANNRFKSPVQVPGCQQRCRGARFDGKAKPGKNISDAKVE